MKNLSRAVPLVKSSGLRAVILFFLLLAFSLQATEKIDINTAPLEDLTKIIHIGPARARELISLRPFSSLDDLIRIRGIGEKRVEGIKKQGLAWVATNQLQPEPQPELNPSTEPDPKPQKEPKKEMRAIVYPSGVLINEILPNTPLGTKDEEGEYIEIFNQNNFEINLSGWKIEDTAGRTTAYTFREGTKIKPLGFLTLSRPTTKITLNNDGDGLNLIQPDGKIIDSASYEKAPRGQSYNKTPSGWAWSVTLTPDLENIVIDQGEKKDGEEIENTLTEDKLLQIIDINTASVKELQKIVGIGPMIAQRIIDARPFYSIDELTKVRGIGPKTLEDIKKQGLAWVNPKLEPPKIEKTESPETQIAAVAETIKQKGLGREVPKSLSVLLIALTIAIFSGVIILILKKKLKPIAIK